MDVKFKALHADAFLPCYAKEGDGALDLWSIDNGTVSREFDYIEYRTGLVCEIPNGYVGLLFPRSSISKYPLSLANSVGVLDSGYRGEITFRFKYTGEGTRKYVWGDRIGQLLVIPYPQVTPVWADSLSASDRGAQGYGSTGK